MNDPARQQSQTELLKSFTGNDKSFNCQGFRQFSASLGMDTVWFDIDDFPTHIAERLTKSVLFVSYHCEQTSAWFHDVVLYGLATDKMGVTAYLVMNPSGKWSDQTSERKWWPQGYQTWQKGHFFPLGSDEEVLIGWKAKGVGKLY